MYISIETKTGVFFVEGYYYRLYTIVPQAGEPETVKTKELLIDCNNGRELHFALEFGDWVYIMNDSGKTINKLRI